MATLDWQARAALPKFLLEIDAIDAAIIARALTEFARANRNVMLRHEETQLTGWRHFSAICRADEEQAADLLKRTVRGERDASALADAMDAKQELFSLVNPMNGGLRNVA